MGYYEVMQICINGHHITSNYNRYPEFRKKFCPDCGSETIHKCPNCYTPIPGEYVQEGAISIGFEPNIPLNCQNCGKPFPWYLKNHAEVESEKDVNPISILYNICKKFHLIAKQLEKRRSKRETIIITDEYDVQDLLHALLHLFFEDIRAEEWTPSYAGGASRVDFLLKKEEIIIEVKKTRTTLKAKEIGEQLIVDSVKYRAHPNCKKLFCFVYDPDGLCSNPHGIETDLNSRENDFELKVLIVPKGH